LRAHGQFIVRVRERACARTHRKLLTLEHAEFCSSFLSLRDPDNELSGPLCGMCMKRFGVTPIAGVS
jgi:hypothetical protein